jgi:hypothetical protein
MVCCGANHVHSDRSVVVTVTVTVAPGELIVPERAESDVVGANAELCDVGSPI